MRNLATLRSYETDIMRILIVEDDRETANYVIKGLRESGHVADHAPNGESGYEMARGHSYDVMVVDRMLPGTDGIALVQRLRRDGDETPVLFLSALGEVDDRVRGLRAGGDDYLAKPYAFAELLARVEALGRRGPTGGPGTTLVVGGLQMDLLTRQVTRDGKIIDLQPREFSLLEYLMRNAGRVVTRTMLLEQVWGYHFDPQTNVIDVHISRLRGKVDKGFDTPLLHTVRGAGYTLRA
jgi:two-component system OmpR family response regulator